MVAAQRQRETCPCAYASVRACDVCVCVQAIVWRDMREQTANKAFCALKRAPRRRANELRIQVNGMHMCLQCKCFLPESAFEDSMWPPPIVCVCAGMS